jgi:hypothetical protein
MVHLWFGERRSSFQRSMGSAVKKQDGILVKICGLNYIEVI